MTRQLICATLFVCANLVYVVLVAADAVSPAVALTFLGAAVAWSLHLSRYRRHRR